MFLSSTFNIGVINSFQSVFDPDLTFPTIQVFDTESEFINQTDAPDYTIVHAKDTNKLYIWTDTFWSVYNQN